MIALGEEESPLKLRIEKFDFAVRLLKEKGAEFITFELSPLEKNFEGDNKKVLKNSQQSMFYKKSVYCNLRSMKTINENFTCHHC